MGIIGILDSKNTELGMSCLASSCPIDCQARQVDGLYATLNIRKLHGIALIDGFFPANL